MSYYYNYCIGYIHQGKLYPLGPYSATGKLKDVISRSASFASDLHNDFFMVQEDMISDELRSAFTYETWDGKKEMQHVKYCPVSLLPSGSAIKKGYFLIEDVRRYESSKDSEVLFFDMVSPTVYSAMADNEVRFGKPAPQKDDFGEEFIPKTASDYMFYAYLDDSSEEYEAGILRYAADVLGEYDSKLPKGYELAVIETEG